MKKGMRIQVTEDAERSKIFKVHHKQSANRRYDAFESSFINKNASTITSLSVVTPTFRQETLHKRKFLAENYAKIKIWTMCNFKTSPMAST